MSYWSLRGVDVNSKKYILSNAKKMDVNISDFVTYIISVYIFDLYHNFVLNDEYSESVRGRVDDKI